MKNLIAFLLVVFVLLSAAVYSQTAQDHINQLTGEINIDWLKVTGKSIPSYKAKYSLRKATGFKETSNLARKQILLDQPWFFHKNSVDEKLSGVVEVKIPHQFNQNRNYKSAWYISKYDIDISSDKRYILKLSRVDMYCKVYVNEEFCGDHLGAYTSFEFDVTEKLVSGNNVMAIYVYDKGIAVNGDKLITQVGPSYLKAGEQGFNLSGGIDDVPILEVREKSYIKDIFVKTSTRNEEIEIEYEVSNPSAKNKISFGIYKWPNGERVKLAIPEVKNTKASELVHSVKARWNNAELWSPDHPNLYVLRTTLENGDSKDVLETRFGFREFWIDGKTFMLNGFPIRLRGESHYHLFRHGVDFHREVFNMHKETFESNACRVHAFMPHPDIFLGADEAGMLIINQSAVWSVNGQLYAKGGNDLLNNLEREFEEWVRRDRNCPSVVIWDVENEMLRFDFDLHLPWISKLPVFVKKLDDTRPINLSGAGWFSPVQDMVSVHMQDHYARIMADWKEKDNRPMITGEFWIGARADQRMPSAPEIKSVQERYIKEAAAYERNILEMRYFGLSGFMPFRISILGLKQTPHSTAGYNFTPPNTLIKEKQSEDVLAKLRHALQPVCVFVWPRETYCAANDIFQRELVVCNDGETTETFEVQWKWDGDERKPEFIEMKPGEQKRLVIKDKAPLESTSIIALVKKDNQILSTDTISIHPIKPLEEKATQVLHVFGDDDLATRLLEAGYNAFANKDVPKATDQELWIIPEHANNRELEAIKGDILNYLNAGGNILCLKQDQVPTWFPVKFQFWSANLVHLHSYAAMGWQGLNKDLRYAKFATILAPSHPVFAGIKTPSLHLWNSFDGRVADDAYARPSTAGKFEQGNWQPLAASAKNTQMSLVEMFYGKGSMLACQLHVIENLQNAQAKRLFDNMLSYLSTKKSNLLNGKIKLDGAIDAATLSKITGAKEHAFQGNDTAKYMLAFDDADVDKIKKWAAKGKTAFVFSEQLSQLFKDVSIETRKESNIVATKVNAHSLLDGISSGNFMKNSSKSFFTNVPKNATVLLQGFESTMGLWRIKEAGPLMISVPFEKGEIILSTISIDSLAGVDERELLRQLLSNMGLAIDFEESEETTITIKKTVPIKVDGALNEWLDDMDDRFVSQYTHAQPVYLTSEHTIEGPTAYDLRLSGINYFLWNENALHIAGVIFSEEKSPTSFIQYGAEKAYTQQVNFNNDVVVVAFKDGQLSVTVNGKTSDRILFENGQLSSEFMTDATKLQFSYINGGGEISTVNSLVGETFELLIPWGLLNSKPIDEPLKTMISIESKGTKLQMPISTSAESQTDWLLMRMSKDAK